MIGMGATPATLTTLPVLAAVSAPGVGPIGCLVMGSALLLWPDRRSWVPSRATRRWSGLMVLRASARTRRCLLWAAGSIAVGVLVGADLLTVSVAAGVAIAAARWLPFARPRGGRARTGRPGEGSDAAVVLDLLATALESGLPMPQAISAVTQADDSEAAAVLHGVGQLLVLGAAPIEAWQPAAADQRFSAVATAAVRSALGGVTVADAARQGAAEIRQAARVAMERSAARAEVAMTAPLALCFLPAFLCLGLAPVVIGLVHGLHLF
jgi:Flp pilus assembly protein TadB